MKTKLNAFNALRKQTKREKEELQNRKTLILVEGFAEALGTKIKGEKIHVLGNKAVNFMLAHKPFQPLLRHS